MKTVSVYAVEHQKLFQDFFKPKDHKINIPISRDTNELNSHQFFYFLFIGG